MNKRRFVWASGCVLALSLLVGGVASAGTVSNTAVTFFTETNGQLSARGTLRVARNSADSNQLIGCSVYSYDTGSYSTVCYARDASGATRSCSTGDANMVHVAQSINPASYVYFSINPDASSCDRLIVVNYSSHL
ncbi:MAG: hypothetical protein ACOY0T_16005 [Myxococcota bacterium]